MKRVISAKYINSSFYQIDYGTYKNYIKYPNYSARYKMY